MTRMLRRLQCLILGHVGRWVYRHPVTGMVVVTYERLESWVLEGFHVEHTCARCGKEWNA